MKKLIVLGSTAALLLSLALPAAAAENNVNADAKANTGMAINITPSGQARIVGKVTAVSSSTLSIQSWGGTWTANVESSDKIVSKGDVKSTLGDIKVGDVVAVNGKVSSSTALTIDASKVLDLNLALKKITLHGVISSLNQAARSFVLTLKNGTTVNVNLASDAALRLGKNSTTSISSLVNGMTVNVSGILNQASNTLNGTKLMGSTNVNSSSSASIHSEDEKAKIKVNSSNGLHIGL